MEPVAAVDWASWLEATPFAITLKQSGLLYPLVNVAHVIGIALLAGSIAALDFRLLGFAKRIPAEAADRYLRSIAAIGLLIALPAGLLMFVADAVTLSVSTVFITKLLLVAAALANAGLFVLLWRKRMGEWDFQPPLLGRTQALASLVLWFGAVSAGRLIAYL